MITPSMKKMLLRLQEHDSRKVECLKRRYGNRAPNDAPYRDRMHRAKLMLDVDPALWSQEILEYWLSLLEPVIDRHTSPRVRPELQTVTKDGLVAMGAIPAPPVIPLNELLEAALKVGAHAYLETRGLEPTARAMKAYREARA